MKQFFKDIWDVLRGRGAEVGEEPSSPLHHGIPSRLPCVGGHQRHLYLGGEVCKRGCGQVNLDFKEGDVAVPSEGL